MEYRNTTVTAACINTRPNSLTEEFRLIETIGTDGDHRFTVVSLLFLFRCRDLYRRSIIITVYVRLDPIAATVFVVKGILQPVKGAERGNRRHQKTHEQQDYRLHSIRGIHCSHKQQPLL